MFKRRNAVVAFLLIAVLLLGIGYAALTDTLTIKGTATADTDSLNDDFDSMLGFSAYAEGNCMGGVAVADTTTDAYTNLPDDVTFTATGFGAKGDKAVVVYTITNKHPDLAAKIGEVTVAPNTHTNFTVTKVLSGTELAANGGTQTITVTIELTATPTVATEQVFTLSFNATTD